MPKENQDKIKKLTKKTSDMLKLLATLSKKMKRIERYLILKNNA